MIDWKRVATGLRAAADVAMLERVHAERLAAAKLCEREETVQALLTVVECNQLPGDPRPLYRQRERELLNAAKRVRELTPT